MVTAPATAADAPAVIDLDELLESSVVLVAAPTAWM
jgi:hypothetical protein